MKASSLAWSLLRWLSLFGFLLFGIQEQRAKCCVISEEGGGSMNSGIGIGDGTDRKWRYRNGVSRVFKT